MSKSEIPEVVNMLARHIRAMAWERAKGELNAMLHGFGFEDRRYERLNKLIEEFVADIENNRLHF